MFDVATEDISVSPTFDRHGGYKSLHADRTTQGQGTAAVTRLGGIRSLSARSPGLQAGQIDMAARLIDEDQLVGWDPGNHFLVGGPGLAACRSVLFRSAEGLFLRVNRSCLRTRCLVVRPTRPWAAAANRSQRSASEASGCC